MRDDMRTDVRDEAGTAVSMTGFGVGRVSAADFTAAVEIKGVNHRFLEIVTHIKNDAVLDTGEDKGTGGESLAESGEDPPRTWPAFEEGIRRIVREVARRGRVDVFVYVTPREAAHPRVKLDKNLALEYDSRLKEMAALLECFYRSDVGFLASCPRVLAPEPFVLDAAALWPVLEEAARQAAHRFACMRRAEGASLARDLLAKGRQLRECVEVMLRRAPEVAEGYRVRLERRLDQLLGDAARSDESLGEARVAQEVALLADRASIEEELVRLVSHLEQLAAALASGETVGRKLDFLLQEINRELNTVGAKANDLVIAQEVIRAKSLAENLKEQVQNME